MAPRIFIIMAVFQPEPEYLAAQMRSLADQSHEDRHLVAVIADTSSAALVATTAAAAAPNLPLTVIPSDVPLDAVRAFEAGLSEALNLIDAQGLDEDAALIALCDQDDIWHADRLERGVAALAASGADLVHSDARLVGPDGTTELHRSMFAFERRKKKPGLRGLLYRNNITGMTMLMRPRLVRLALPFPPQSGVHFYHDLWLGLLASATGGVHLIDAPLVDYRQHQSNVMGAIDRSQAKGPRWKRPDAMWMRKEATAYALARYLGQSTYNRLSDAVTDGRLKHGEAKTAPLRPYLRRCAPICAACAGWAYICAMPSPWGCRGTQGWRGSRPDSPWSAPDAPSGACGKRLDRGCEMLSTHLIRDSIRCHRACHRAHPRVSPVRQRHRPSTSPLSICARNRALCQSSRPPMPR